MVPNKTWIFLLGLPLIMAAEGQPPQPGSVAAVADFTNGFKRLEALGLPSLEGAVWASAGEQSREMDDYELRELFAGLKGGGWKLQTKDKPVFLSIGSVKSIEASGNEGNAKSGSFLGGLFGGGSKKAKTVDLVTDANSLIETLDNPEKSKEFRQRLEYSGASSLGRLLIFASQLHQSGHPAEANRLANTLFNLGVSPETVIDAAINHLAARDLSVVTEDFFTNHDWKTYERDLRTLSARYPRGWEAYPAVQMLIPQVAKKVAGEMPAKPTMEGVTLNPAAIAALDETLKESKGAPDDEAVTRFAKERGISLAQLSPQMRSQIAEMLSNSDERGSDGPWLLEDLTKSESKDPWTKLKRLGLDALPALAAVANDDTLTLSRNASSGGRSSFSHFGRSRESAADQALAIFQSMDRPLTRGELARRLLASTLPGEDRDEGGPQALADSAMEFWKAHRGKSKLNLLLVFLSEGDSSQKQTAATSLAAMPEEAAHAAFENYVLESDDLTSTLNSVTPYLKIRKAGAKEFFTRFSVAFKAQLEGVDLEQISGGYEIKGAGGVDKYLKKLSLFVSGESPRKLVLALAKAEKPNTQQIYSLAETVSESSPDQFIPLFLEAAVTATNVKTRAAFLSALSSQGRSPTHEDEKENEKDAPIPTAQIPHWKTLLDDERMMGDGREGSQIRNFAASLLEQSSSSIPQRQFYEIYQLDPVAASELTLTRAKDRIAGKSPTPLPDAEKVPPTRLEEILKQLVAAKPEAVHDLVKSWPLDEKLAFKKWRSDPENAAKLPASLVAARRLLLPPTETSGGPPVAQTSEILKSLDLKPGTQVDYECITKLANSLALASKKHSGLVLIFANSPLETGVVINATRPLESSENRRGYEHQYLSMGGSELKDPNTEAVVSLSWISERRRALANWKINGKTITAPEAELLENFKESMSSTDQPEARRFGVNLTVLHRDDLEKLTKLNQSSREEDSESSDELPDLSELPE